MTPTQKDKDKFNSQKYSAKQRGIEFHLTFEQWWNIWQQSGVYHLRGVGKDKYCMGRFGDVGAYALGNVYICTNAENGRSGHIGLKHTAEAKAKISAAMKGPKSAETKAKMRGPKSQEHSAKIAAANKARNQSEAMRSKLRKPKSAETRAKISATKKAKWALKQETLATAMPQPQQ
ncbi:hypothetical protein [Burkholderia sp. BC1]|uniref:hypothetical protein n=1 Tax=Burkholderia sp. BC1 TaxID=1095370 RepID=UPI004044C17D